MCLLSTHDSQRTLSYIHFGIVALFITTCTCTFNAEIEVLFTYHFKYINTNCFI